MASCGTTKIEVAFDRLTHMVPQMRRREVGHWLGEEIDLHLARHRLGAYQQPAGVDTARDEGVLACGGAVARQVTVPVSGLSGK